MKCTNCRKPITGTAAVRTVQKHVGGTVNRTRTKLIANCDACQRQIDADMKASSERHAADLAQWGRELLGSGRVDKLIADEGGAR